MLNKYQKMLERKLYFCSLAIKTDNNETPQYINNITKKHLKTILQEMPQATIIGENINGHLLTTLPFVNMETLSVKKFAENLDNWLTKDETVPDLFIVGGYYPRKDGNLIFEIQCHSNKEIYIYGKLHACELPIYKITDEKLIRIEQGSIASPKIKLIDEEIDKAIVHQLKNNNILFI